MRQILMTPCLLFLVCGCSGAKSTPAWVEQLQAHASAERLRAAQALGERRAEATMVVPALTNALKDTDAFVRREAAKSLGRIGPDAQPAVPQLTAALRDRQPKVRQAAKQALKTIVPARGD